jgi:hypothetical protein
LSGILLGTEFAICLFAEHSSAHATGELIMDNSKMKIAYVITTRNGKHFWNRCGVAFVNNDGSINVKLEAVPVNGEIQIRDYVPRDEVTGTTLRGRGPNGHSDEDSLAELG